MLQLQLEKRITGEGSATVSSRLFASRSSFRTYPLTLFALTQIIERIRHSTSYISTLSPHLQEQATLSYAISLKAVFIVQAALALLAILVTLCLPEYPLDGNGGGAERAREARKAKDLARREEED